MDHEEFDPLLLPPLARDLIEVIGRELALKLILEFRAQRVWIPAKPAPDHPVSLCIGHKAATKIGWWLAPGAELDFPVLAKALRRQRDSAILADAAECTVSELCRKNNLSRRALFYAKARAKKAAAETTSATALPTPPDLFSD